MFTKHDYVIADPYIQHLIGYKMTQRVNGEIPSVGNSTARKYRCTGSLGKVIVLVVSEIHSIECKICNACIYLTLVQWA